LLDIAAPIVTILIGLGAYGLGSPLVRRFDCSETLSEGERVLISGLIGAVVMAGLVWLIGLIRYDALSMLVVLVVAVTSALLSTKISVRPVTGLYASIPKGAWRLVPLAILLVVFVGIVGSYAPPSDHDTIRYQLYLPDRDLIWGKIGVKFGWSVYEFLPPLGAMLTRLAYALGGVVGAQLLNMLWLTVAAASTAALTFRLAGRTDIAWLAALFLISQRVSINLASAVSMEFVLAAYAGGVLLVILALMRRPNVSMGILLGLMVGGLINVKHHGLVYAGCVYLPMVFLSLRRREYRFLLFISVMVSLAILLPWLVRNSLVTGNPFFPAFHQLFGNDNINLFKQILTTNRIEMDFLSIAQIPWNIFVNQLEFDGLQFGIPFLLLFIPFAFLTENRQRLFLLVAIVVSYLSVWFLVMPHYIRFLVPLFPILCTLAALGSGVVADATNAVVWKRRLVLFIVVGLGVAQSGFLVATGARRLPAALNITSPAEFLESKPFLHYSQYNACHWVSDHLADDEAYLALLNSPTIYCSVAKAFPNLLPDDDKTIYTQRGRPAVPSQWLGKQLLKCSVRYVIVAKNLGADSEPYVFAKHRYDAQITDAVTNLSPVYQTPVANVFDGGKVAEALLRLPSEGRAPLIFRTDEQIDNSRCAVPIGG
jgi:hypothetical protein